MNRILLLVLCTLAHPLFADNEIFMDQSGATANIDLEQQGGGNLIGGVGSVAGTLTDFDFIGTTNTLDINQISRVDRDSLHTLPLAMLPIDNPALKRARLIKNARLNSVVHFQNQNCTIRLLFLQQ